MSICPVSVFFAHSKGLEQEMKDPEIQELLNKVYEAGGRNILAFSVCCKDGKFWPMIGKNGVERRFIQKEESLPLYLQQRLRLLKPRDSWV